MTDYTLPPYTHIRAEQPSDAATIEALLDLCFGAARTEKTAYRLRDGVAPLHALSYVVDMQDAQTNALRLIATIRYWPVLLPNDSLSLLLGPIAVDPALQNSGIGAALMYDTMQRARALGAPSLILVGDAPYYTRFGFNRDVMLGLEMPGWVDLNRLLGLEYVGGSLSQQKGVLRRYSGSLPVAMQHIF
jgi:predicted N-acetyltransferase YhbS